MNYRYATTSDIDQLVNLRIRFLKEIDNEQRDQSTEDRLVLELKKYFLHHLLAGSYVNWLALDNNEVVATGGICFNEFPPGFTALNENRAYIMNIYTLPEYRNKGIAKHIFEMLMAEAANRKVCMVSLHTTPDGKHLYEKFGFRLKNNEMALLLMGIE